MSMLSNKLTQDELLHLAVEATRRGEHGAAISYLKEGVTRFPADGKLAYVLGAEFAQIGMYDKAEAEMSRAIELEPSLHTASFQLGLLQLTLGKVADAKLTWTRLNILPQENALYLFKSGLESMADEQYLEARRQIEQGIAVNDFSPELTRDMQNVLSSLPVVEEDNGVGHVLLSAYNSDKPN